MGSSLEHHAWICIVQNTFDKEERHKAVNGLGDRTLNYGRPTSIERNFYGASTQVTH